MYFNKNKKAQITKDSGYENVNSYKNPLQQSDLMNEQQTSKLRFNSLALIHRTSQQVWKGSYIFTDKEDTRNG